jgi:protein-S-isoprenylcysteine O-methyltransferase Ste14
MLQIVAVALCCFPFDSQTYRYEWLVPCALGAATGIWSLLHNLPGNFGIYPEIRSGGQLVTSGPYRWVRHPMYASLLLMMSGICLYNGLWPNFLGLGLLGLALGGKIRREECYLHQEFPGYATYAQSTKRLIPYLL